MKIGKRTIKHLTLSLMGDDRICALYLFEYFFANFSSRFLFEKATGILLMHSNLMSWYDFSKLKKGGWLRIDLDPETSRRSLYKLN